LEASSGEVQAACLSYPGLASWLKREVVWLPTLGQLVRMLIEGGHALSLHYHNTGCDAELYNEREYIDGEFENEPELAAAKLLDAVKNV
jgi:hypothetical protein